MRPVTSSSVENGRGKCLRSREISSLHSEPPMVFFSSKPRLSILADSDEESSSAGSSDEEEVPPSELQGCVGEKSAAAAAAEG